MYVSILTRSAYAIASSSRVLSSHHHIITSSPVLCCRLIITHITLACVVSSHHYTSPPPFYSAHNKAYVSISLRLACYHASYGWPVLSCHHHTYYRHIITPRAADLCYRHHHTHYRLIITRLQPSFRHHTYYRLIMTHLLLSSHHTCTAVVSTSHITCARALASLTKS